MKRTKISILNCLCSSSWLAAGALALVVTTGCRGVGGKNGQSAMAPSLINEVPELSEAQMADVHFGLARSLEAKGDIPKAMSAYYEALKRDRSRADIYHRLAILHDQQGKWQDSNRYYTKAIELEPGSADVYCDMGYSMYLQRRWHDAEMNLRQAVTLDDNHERAYNNLGLVYARQQRNAEALAAFKRGGCSESDAHSNLALACAVERHFDQALSEYRLALAANPNSKIAREGLNELTAAIAKLEQKLPGDTVLAANEARKNLRATEVREALAQQTPNKVEAQRQVPVQPVVATAQPAARSTRVAQRTRKAPERLPATQVSNRTRSEQSTGPSLRAPAASRSEPTIKRTTATEVVEPTTAVEKRISAADRFQAALGRMTPDFMKDEVEQPAAKTSARPVRLPTVKTPAQPQPKAVAQAEIPAEPKVEVPAEPKVETPTQRAPRRLSFAPGALRRDRYLEEQADASDR